MNLKLSAQIAKTHLFSKRKQTIIASLGVTFGIAMFIVMISFMTGVNQFLEDTTLTSTPHIRIFQDIEPNRKNIVDEYFKAENSLNILHHQKPKEQQLNIKNGLMIAKLIENEPNVLGVSPQLNSQVFYNYGPTQIPGTLAGVDILAEDKLYDLQSKMKQGVLQNLITGTNGIIMGSGLAQKMNINIDDKVMVTTPLGFSLQLRVVGIFQTGIGAIDNIKSYANIATVQKILQKDTRYITDIHIKLNDLNEAKTYAQNLKNRFGYKAEDWETANATILMSFVIRNVMTFVVVTTLLIVAGFGIYNIMNMTIYDKMKDIAILKATGFEGNDIVSIFLLQAIFIGLMGGSLGLIIGFFLSFLLSITPFDTGGMMAIETFPVNFNPMFYVSGFIFGILTTAFAGYFPSRKASKIDPVAILRG